MLNKDLVMSEQHTSAHDETSVWFRSGKCKTKGLLRLSLISSPTTSSHIAAMGNTKRFTISKEHVNTTLHSNISQAK